jgi:nitrogen fixation NifU-like protein
MTKGKTLDEARSLSKKAVAEALDGLPKEKMHCSNLGAEALANAVDDYNAKKYGKPKSVAQSIGEKEPETDVMCGHCKTENPATAKFCMNCGEEISH